MALHVLAVLVVVALDPLADRRGLGQRDVDRALGGRARRCRDGAGLDGALGLPVRGDLAAVLVDVRRHPVEAGPVVVGVDPLTLPVAGDLLATLVHVVGDPLEAGLHRGQRIGSVVPVPAAGVGVPLPVGLGGLGRVAAVPLPAVLLLVPLPVGLLRRGIGRARG